MTKEERKAKMDSMRSGLVESVGHLFTTLSAPKVKLLVEEEGRKGDVPAERVQHRKDMIDDCIVLAGVLVTALPAIKTIEVLAYIAGLADHIASGPRSIPSWVQAFMAAKAVGADAAVPVFESDLPPEGATIN